FIMGLQQKFALPSCKEYSAGYAALMKKLVFLDACSVPAKECLALLTSEKRLLELLKVDSLDPVPEWFENLCSMKHGPNRLLLSGYDLERKSGVQPGLDFAEREKELFGHRGMGADALRALELCRKASDAIRARLAQELPLLSVALKWGRNSLRSAV
ncbi:MAG: hypothetical protein WCG03_01005, partial [Kiritimatiellales bacterium]